MINFGIDFISDVSLKTSLGENNRHIRHQFWLLWNYTINVDRVAFLEKEKKISYERICDKNIDTQPWSCHVSMSWLTSDQHQLDPKHQFCYWLLHNQQMSHLFVPHGLTSPMLVCQYIDEYTLLKSDFIFFVCHWHLHSYLI